LDSLASMPDSVTLDQKMRTLTIAALRRQESDEPVHNWPLASVSESGGWRHSYQTVGQFMTTDVFTVQPNDIVDLAAHLMDWAHLRHIPVEDKEGHLVGLVSHRALLRLIGMGKEGRSPSITIADIMKRDPVSVKAETPTLEAIAIMRREKVGCLPIVEDQQLVGVITERDLVRVAAELLERHLQEESGAGFE
jgi:CBS domain-containing protein